MKKAFISLIILGSLFQLSVAQKTDIKRLNFPKDFLWGAASAAYQVEGGTKADGRGPNTWDKYLNPPYSLAKMSTGQDVNGDVAINQYDRTQFMKDVKLMKELGINTYRLSISWSRILPEGTGKVNEAGIDYYNFVINALIKENIKPLVTLSHFEMPLALNSFWQLQYAAIKTRHSAARVSWFFIDTFFNNQKVNGCIGFFVFVAWYRFSASCSLSGFLSPFLKAG